MWTVMEQGRGQLYSEAAAAGRRSLLSRGSGSPSRIRGWEQEEEGSASTSDWLAGVGC